MKNESNENLEFIKNVLTVDVNALKATNHYTINAMYDKIDKDGFVTTTYKLIDEFDYTWDEIERDGGITQVNKDLKECYNV
jgi:hypothetical protein